MDLLARIIRASPATLLICPPNFADVSIDDPVSVLFIALSHQVKCGDTSWAFAATNRWPVLLEADPAEFVTTPDGVSSIFYQVNELG